MPPSRTKRFMGSRMRIDADGKAARWPLSPAASSMAASPHALLHQLRGLVQIEAISAGAGRWARTREVGLDRERDAVARTRRSTCEPWA